MSDKFYIGDPMTPKEFGELLKEMYKKDENGIPLWKKVFKDDKKEE